MADQSGSVFLSLRSGIDATPNSFSTCARSTTIEPFGLRRCSMPMAFSARACAALRHLPVSSASSLRSRNIAGEWPSCVSSAGRIKTHLGSLEESGVCKRPPSEAMAFHPEFSAERIGLQSTRATDLIEPALHSLTAASTGGSRDACWESYQVVSRAALS